MVVLAAGLSACSSGGSPAGAPSGAPIAAGSPWLGAFAPVALPAPVNALTALDCPNASSCWAVGSTVGGAGAPNGAAVIVTADGGATWKSQVIPPTVGYLSGISCSDPRHCAAVGQASQTSNGQGVIIATSNGGATWTQSTTPPGILDVTAVACLPDRRCIATGTDATGVVALVSTSPGSGWEQRGVFPGSVSGATAVSCSDDQHCWVTAHTSVDVDHVAGVVAVTTTGGSVWTKLNTPTGLGYLNGVSCLSGSGSGSGALPFTSTTAATTTPTVPRTQATTAVTTPAVPGTTTTTIAAGVAGVRCTVVGTTSTVLNGARTGHGVIITTDNGGARWSNQSVPIAAAALRAVTCTSIGSCVAVGSSVATSAQAGVVILTGSANHPWKQAALVGLAQPLSAVSCVSNTRCVLVGESISAHLVGG
jgi:hypothetical protein